MKYPIYLCQTLEPFNLRVSEKSQWVTYHTYRNHHRAVEWFEGMLVNVRTLNLEYDWIRVVYKEATRYHQTVLASYGSVVYISFVHGHFPVNPIAFVP